MNAVDYLTSLLLLALVLGGFGVSAHALRARLLPDWSGAPALLGLVVLAIAVATVTAQLLGIAGLLTAPALVVTSVGLALALSRIAPGRPPETTPHRVSSGRAGAVLALVAALLTATHWAGPVFHSFDVGIYRQDSTWYHLPFAAWFAQTGTIDGLLHTDPLKLAVWYYPLNSELLHALGMVLLDSDVLSPLLNFGWLGVALLAAWCIGRPFGLAAATALGAILVLDSDMMLVQAGNAPGDVAALACLLAVLALLIDGTSTDDGPGTRTLGLGPLAVTALAAGLAIGTKVTMLVPVAVLTAGVLLTGPERSWRRTGVWFGGLGITGGFWYLRNLLHSGNPLPWLQAGPLAGPDQEPIYPRPAHAVVEYLADRHAWSEYFLPGLADTLGPLWPLVLFAALAGIVLGLRRRNTPLVRIVALAGAATLIVHAFNPISASGPDGAPYGFGSNLRYAAPGITIGLVLLPLCETRWTASRILIPAYSALIAIGALASAEWVQPAPLAAIALAVGVVGVPAWLLYQRRSPWPRVAAVGGVVIAVLGGYVVQQHYFDNRYRADAAPSLDNPGFRSTPQWHLIQEWAHDIHGARIGIVGTPAAYGQYVLYGEDLSNAVRYIGEPGARGGFTAIHDCRRWRERVNAGDFDAIVITPEDPGSAVPPPQIAWTESPGASAPAVNAMPAAVYLVTAPLDPDQCERIEALYGSRNGPPTQLPPNWLPGGFRSPGTAGRLPPPGGSDGRPSP